jgi:hypothetical protein
MGRILIAFSISVLIAGGLITSSAGENSRPKMGSKEAREDKKIARTSKEITTKKPAKQPSNSTNIRMDGADR